MELQLNLIRSKSVHCIILFELIDHQSIIMVNVSAYPWLMDHESLFILRCMSAKTPLLTETYNKNVLLLIRIFFLLTFFAEFYLLRFLRRFFADWTYQWLPMYKIQCRVDQTYIKKRLTSVMSIGFEKARRNFPITILL